MRGWIRGNWRHLMVGLLCAAIVISGTALYLTYRQSDVIFCERKEWIGIEERSPA